MCLFQHLVRVQEGVFAQWCVWQEGCVLQGGVRWRGRGGEDEAVGGAPRHAERDAWEGRSRVCSIGSLKNCLSPNFIYIILCL